MLVDGGMSETELAILTLTTGEDMSIGGQEA